MFDDTSTFFCQTEIRITSTYREMIQMKTIKIFFTGKRIQFLFATLRLETHANCSFDYLEVYDGDAIGKRDALKN